MQPPRTTVEQVQRNHLIILSPDHQDLLVQLPGGLGYLLPSVRSDVGRKVLGVVKAYVEQLGISMSSVVSLCTRESVAGGFEALHVLQASNTNASGKDFHWRPLGKIVNAPGLWDVQATFVREFAKEAPRLCTSSPPARASSWVDQILFEAGLGVVTGFEPFRISTAESVVAFRTSRGETAYLKCSNRAPFTEALVTQVLANKWPTAVAETIGFCATNGWWLTKEVKGATLEQALTLEQCVAAINRFARMQKDLRNERASFANCGMCSTRLIDLDVGATLRALAEAGQITSQELSKMQSSLKRVFARLVELDFPESIIHRDLTPWNIKLAHEGPCFFDWEDATWGPAIVSLEIFLAALRTGRRNLRSSGWLEQLREGYFQVWGLGEERWTDASLARASRTLALFCQLRDFSRTCEAELYHAHLKDQAVLTARKLYRLLQ